jgi:hypothetical protein
MRIIGPESGQFAVDRAWKTKKNRILLRAGILASRAK